MLPHTTHMVLFQDLTDPAVLLSLGDEIATHAENTRHAGPWKSGVFHLFARTGPHFSRILPAGEFEQPLASRKSPRAEDTLLHRRFLRRSMKLSGVLPDYARGSPVAIQATCSSQRQ